jgi:outer membrane lipoprotein-sorting protein
MRLVTCFFLALLCLRGDSIKEILDRMDAEALNFKGVKANLSQDEYTAAIKDHTLKTAALAMAKKKGGGGVTALLDYKTPDPQQFLFKDNSLQQYLPNVNLIQEYDLGKHSSVVNQFLMLAFGSSGKDLDKNYKITLIGPDPVGGVNATKLVLIPKSADALKYMNKIESWIPDGKGYAVQLKIYSPSGDSNTATYSGIDINPASLNDHPIELNAPKNAAREKH